MKSKSEPETHTLSSRLGPDSKPSEVRRLMTYSAVLPRDTPNFLCLFYSKPLFVEGIGKGSFPDGLACILHSYYIISQWCFPAH